MKKKIKAILRANEDKMLKWATGDLSFSKMANILAKKIEEELHPKEVCPNCKGAGQFGSYYNNYGYLMIYTCHQCNGAGEVSKNESI